MTVVIVTVVTVAVVTVVIVTYFRKKQLETLTADEMFSVQLFAILAMNIPIGQVSISSRKQDISSRQLGFNTIQKILKL